ncbi:MAG: FAD-dependent oxidoreductase [Oceanospirillaceae bacterium]|nr:FAD-dependent oxidoreductase [Oceanospirillaceae bacterium]MCP5335498.1 FAD-dependent oxidoreductase [Oceanospirillaceae bacterium]MCP5349969.1 FAD-dependent oxidoreductase [Oceanospirillaceae bacterium]
MQQDILILGAGMAGLIAARQLQSTGYRVTLLDKARGPGGRLASKRLDGWQFDMGAQYITASSTHMQAHTQQWLEAGWLAPWQGEFVHWQHGQWQTHTGAARFVGQPRMSALSRGLSENLELDCGQPVTHICRQEGIWQVSLASGRRYTAPLLISTLPLPQLQHLLNLEPELARHITPHLPDAHYAPCWALGYRLAQPWPCRHVSISLQGHPLLDFICHENSKPGRDGDSIISVQCTAAFSQKHLEVDKTELAQLVWQAVEEITGQHMPVAEHYAHRWLYARTQPASASESCLWLAELGFGAAGDIFTAGKVEGALISALQLAEKIIQTCDPV